MAIVILAATPAARALPADLPEVLQVVADQCPMEPQRRHQTGFLAQGYDGVLTALHGVLGCSSIVAREFSTGLVFVDLQISQVDIARDVALLRSPALSAGSLARLAVGPVPSAGDKAWLVGYPQAIKQQFRTDLTVEDPNILLEGRIPDLQEVKTPVLLRASPAINIRILSLSGDIQPGHSGAPLLDVQNRVVGIGNGGLKGGTVGIGWAIPLEDLDLDPTTEPKVAPVLAGLKKLDAALIFAVATEEDVQVPEPVAWSKGEACLIPGFTFDLDAGIYRPNSGDADLFYENVNGVERYLRGWQSGMAAGGVADLEVVPYSKVRDAAYGSGRFDARWGGGVVKPGSVWFVKTSESRFSKLRILRQGHFMKFRWITYSRPGEGSLPSQTTSGPCSVEEQLQCGEGMLPGDAIHSFRVENLKRTEALLQVNAAYNGAHGPVYVVPVLLDQNGENISDGYRPTFASQGSTFVPVLYLRPSPAQSKELLVYLFESGRPAEAFVCRRFPFSQYWGPR